MQKVVNTNTGEQRESYRIFKEQFNLDKPVLLNTRYGLTNEEVSDVMTNILNEDGSVSPALRIEAQETMENWGRYAVPALIDILNTSDNIAKRALASQRLTINARKRMAGEFRKDLTAEQKAGNKIIAAEIESFKGKYFMAGESEDSKAISEEESKAFWNTWYDANKDDFAYSGAEKVSIFFLIPVLLSIGATSFDWTLGYLTWINVQYSKRYSVN